MSEARYIGSFIRQAFPQMLSDTLAIVLRSAREAKTYWQPRAKHGLDSHEGDVRTSMSKTDDECRLAVTDLCTMQTRESACEVQIQRAEAL